MLGITLIYVRLLLLSSTSLAHDTYDLLLLTNTPCDPFSGCDRCDHVSDSDRCALLSGTDRCDVLSGSDRCDPPRPMAPSMVMHHSSRFPTSSTGVVEGGYAHEQRWRPFLACWQRPQRPQRLKLCRRSLHARKNGRRLLPNAPLLHGHV